MDDFLDPIPPAPQWIIEAAGAPKDKTPRIDVPACELDSPSAILAASRYAKSAEPSIEGQGGDSNAIRVVCRMRDFGVSEDTCREILIDEWNPRCLPPWEFEELQTKVENGYQYARNQVGCDSPEAILAMLPNVEVKSPFKWMGDLDFKDIPKREWQLGRRFLKGFLTVTISPGGQGKSTLTMTEAAAIASGRDLTGDRVFEKGRVWIINTEDPFDELLRRMAAITIMHNLTKADLQNICITTGRLRLVKESKDGPKVDTKLLAWMIDHIIKNHIIHIVIDPFVRCHAVNENDNMAIDQVAQCLSEVARKGKCSVSLVHHTRKKTGSNGAGDMDTARGASSLLSAARIAHTLVSMSDAEARSAKVPERAKWFVRLDDAKANMSPPGEGTKWFEKVSIDLPNGDRVGAIRPAGITEELILTDKDKDIVAAVGQYWTQPISCHQMAQELIKHNRDPQRDWKFSTLKERIICLFSGVQRDAGNIILTAILADGKKSKANILVEITEATEATESNGDAF